MPTTMQAVYDHLATCGHRLGQTVFRPGGMECQTCGRFFPWKTPLSVAPVNGSPTPTPTPEAQP